MKMHLKNNWCCYKICNVTWNHNQSENKLQINFRNEHGMKLIAQTSSANLLHEMWCEKYNFALNSKINCIQILRDIAQKKFLTHVKHGFCIINDMLRAWRVGESKNGLHFCNLRQIRAITVFILPSDRKLDCLTISISKSKKLCTRQLHLQVLLVQY